MFKKNIALYTIITLILFTSSLLVSQQPPNALAPQAGMGRPPLNFTDMKMPQLTDAEIKEALKMLEELPPEALEQLAKIGEEVIKEAESQGLDAREIFGLPSDEELQKIIQEAEQDQPSPTPAVTPAIEAPKAEEKIAQPLASKTEILNARTMLNTIIDRIEEVSQKAEIDRKTRETVNQMSFLMNDLVSYLHILEQDNLTKYLFEKETSPLYQNLKRLEHTLNQLVPQFDLPESFYEGINPYTTLGLSPNTPWLKTNEHYQKLLKERDPFMLKKQWQQEEMSPEELVKKVNKAKQEYTEYKEAYSLILDREKSLQAFEKIVQALTQAVFQGKLIDHIKEVIKRYEPEALKLKERQEKLETQSRKEQEEALKRRPPYAPMVFEPPLPPIPPAYPDKPSVYIPPIPTAPTKAPEGMQPSPTPGATVGKDGKIRKDEKKDNKDKKRTPLEFGKGDDKDKKPDTKLSKRLENIEKEVKNIAYYIDTGELDVPAPRNLFRDFASYLAKPIATINPDDKSIRIDAEELNKAKHINTALNKMTSIINKISQELWELKTLPQDQQIELLSGTRKLISKDFPFQEKIKDLIRLHIDKDVLTTIGGAGTLVPATINRDKTFVHLGKSFADINTEGYKPLKELNKSEPLMTPLETFIKAWKSLNNKISRR